MECQRCPVQKIIDAFVSTNNLEDFTSGKSSARFRREAQNLQSAISDICVKCAKTAHDENPSNHGRDFVSLDSAIESRGYSSGSPSSAFDFLMSRQAPDVRPPAVEVAPFSDSVPESVQHTLRVQLANLSALSPMDLCLIAHLLGGGTFASFGRMDWLHSLPFDPVTARPVAISRQAAYSRFRSICRKIPVLAAIAPSGTPASDPARSASTGRPSRKTTASTNGPAPSDLVGGNDPRDRDAEFAQESFRADGTPSRQASASEAGATSLATARRRDRPVSSRMAKLRANPVLLAQARGRSSRMAMTMPSETAGHFISQTPAAELEAACLSAHSRPSDPSSPRMPTSACLSADGVHSSAATQAPHRISARNIRTMVGQMDLFASV